jgi:hypothetical protein
MPDTIDLGMYANLDPVPPLAQEDPTPDLDEDGTTAEWFEDWEEHLGTLRRSRSRSRSRSGSR